MIREAALRDAQCITEIYNHYIVHTTVTFEEHPVTDAVMRSRILTVQESSLPWLVLEQESQILGYAYASRWKDRSAYRFSVEVSVYLHHQHTGRGSGAMLYEALFKRLSVKGIHLAIGGITLPNAASVALHNKFGMKKVAHFEEVGKKFGRWLDVGYWQKTLSCDDTERG